MIAVLINLYGRHTIILVEGALFFVAVFNSFSRLTTHEFCAPLGPRFVDVVGVEVFVGTVVDHAEAAILVVGYLARLWCAVVFGFCPACGQCFLHHLVGLLGALCFGYLC